MENILPENLPFFVMLFILLIVARLMGEIVEQFKIPSMIGEILAGVIMGPSVFGVIHFDNDLKVFMELGVFLLVVIAGMEIDINEVFESMRGKKLAVAFLGFFVPVASGYVVGYIFNLDILITTYVSLCIAITALPVSVRILMDLKKLNSKIGRSIISVAIFNDVVALLILGILLDIKEIQHDYWAIATTVGTTLLKVVGFLTLILLSYRLLARATRNTDFIKEQLDKLIKVMKGKESLFAVLFTFILIFASVSELVGLHFVVGAFFGAMLISKAKIGDENFKNFEKTTNSITMGFLAPIFFACIGIEFSITSIDNYGFLFAILFVSFMSKIGGGFVGARIAGFSNEEAVTLGVGLNARGIMELVIANIALSAGVIDVSIFSVLVIMGIVTTIVTPYYLRYSFDKMDKGEKLFGIIKSSKKS
jgi:Kef-type K+ transport system membrane component KefB